MPNTSPNNSDTNAPATNDPDTDDEDIAPAPSVDCDALVALPVESTTLSGFSGSEDFAFDDVGNLVSTDMQYNVTKQTKDIGAKATLFSPNIGGTTGTRYLSTGELAVASPENGQVLLIAADGVTRPMISGLNYPNGLEVGADDVVYVSDLAEGVIHQIDPTTMEAKVIARGLAKPNGLSFSPDYKTLYVNSFSDGTVHSITVDGQGNWGEPQLLGSVLEGQLGDEVSEDTGRGNLDGLTVDACGNVYVTEFVVGVIWRFTPDGSLALVASLPSIWIPSLHWGVGIGGWDENILYVMDRERGDLFELALNVPEKQRVFPPNQ